MFWCVFVLVLEGCQWFDLYGGAGAGVFVVEGEKRARLDERRKNVMVVEGRR